MKPKLIKRISGAVLAIILTLTYTQFLVSAQDSQEEQRAENSHQFSKNASQIEGVWESQVTQRVCATGDAIRTFRGLSSFISGGSLIATNSNPPTTGSPALGRWKYLGGRRYIATFRFYRFNPDGSWAGTQRVTRTITLTQNDQLTGTISIEIFDVNDNLMQTGCATETAKRVE